MCLRWLPYVPLYSAIFITILPIGAVIVHVFDHRDRGSAKQSQLWNLGSINCHPAALPVDQQVLGEADLSPGLLISDCLEECRMSLFPSSSQPHLSEIINISMMLFQN